MRRLRIKFFIVILHFFRPPNFFIILSIISFKLTNFLSTNFSDSSSSESELSKSFLFLLLFKSIIFHFFGSVIFSDFDSISLYSEAIIGNSWISLNWVNSLFLI